MNIASLITILESAVTVMPQVAADAKKVDDDISAFVKSVEASPTEQAQLHAALSAVAASPARVLPAPVVPPAPFVPTAQPAV